MRGQSLLRHAGLAQADEIGVLKQGADLRHAETCDALQTGDACIRNTMRISRSMSRSSLIPALSREAVDVVECRAPAAAARIFLLIGGLDKATRCMCIGAT